MGDKLPCSAQPGFFCPPGSSSPEGIKCPAGKFCLGGTEDAAECTAAPGFFCPAGATTGAGVKCMHGKFCVGGIEAPRDCECQAGKFCPEGSSQPDGVPCPEGSFCSGSVANALTCDCDPGSSCPVGSTSEKGQLCSAGFFCAGGTALPLPCAAPPGELTSLTASFRSVLVMHALETSAQPFCRYLSMCTFLCALDMPLRHVCTKRSCCVQDTFAPKETDMKWVPDAPSVSFAGNHICSLKCTSCHTVLTHRMMVAAAPHPSRPARLRQDFIAQRAQRMPRACGVLMGIGALLIPSLCLCLSLRVRCNGALRSRQ